MIPRQPTQEEIERDKRLREEMYALCQKYDLQMILWVGQSTSSAVSKCTATSLHFDIIPMALTVLGDMSIKMNVEAADEAAKQEKPGAGG